MIGVEDQRYFPQLCIIQILLKKHASSLLSLCLVQGTAEVVFLHYSDAIAAIKRYNNVQLDGKPLKIELVGLNLVTPPAVLPTGESILGKPNGAFRRYV